MQLLLSMVSNIGRFQYIR